MSYSDTHRSLDLKVELKTVSEFEQLAALLAAQHVNLIHGLRVERDRKQGVFDTQEEYDLTFEESTFDIEIVRKPRLSEEGALRLEVLREEKRARLRAVELASVDDIFDVEDSDDIVWGFTPESDTSSRLDQPEV